jgi:hypothetical protein
VAAARLDMADMDRHREYDLSADHGAGSGGCVRAAARRGDPAIGDRRRQGRLPACAALQRAGDIDGVPLQAAARESAVRFAAACPRAHFQTGRTDERGPFEQAADARAAIGRARGFYELADTLESAAERARARRLARARGRRRRLSWVAARTIDSPN